MQPVTATYPAVPHGPRAYRRQIRTLGPVAGMLPPAAMGALALLLHANSTTTWQGMGSFLLAVLAAPCLLVAGVPLSSGGNVYVVAIAASVAIWFGVATIAARRATRTPVASWRDFWREYLWLAGGVWLGVAGALLAADLLLGRPFP